MSRPRWKEAGEPLVLHVVPTPLARGAQREARALADRLDSPGYRRHRVLSLFAGPQGIRVDESLEHPGGDRAAVGFEPRLVLRLRAEIARLGPAAVVAHGGDPLKYLVPALMGRRLPLVYYAIGTFGHSDRRAQVVLWRALMRRADVVACEGEEVLAECRNLLGVPDRRLVLAPNGRDPRQFRPVGSEDQTVRDAAGGAPVVAFVGAFTAGKGPDRFVEVVARLRERGIALRAVACGDGPLFEELKGPSSDAGVELLGSRPDVDLVLREADVLVFPSRPTGEGMPGVLIEAGLSAVPVVATDVPGVRSIVEDGSTGFVVPVDDLDFAAQATANLVEDPGLRTRMGIAARDRCTVHFTIDAVAACWLGFLEPLMAGGQAGSRRKWAR